MDTPASPVLASLRAPLAHRRLVQASLAAAALLLAACSSSGNTGSTSGTGAGTSSSSSTGTTTTTGSGGSGGAGGEMRGTDPQITVALQGRTYDIYFPSTLDPSTPAPLFLELHGFVAVTDTMTPWLAEEAANNFKPVADQMGIILVLPHSTIDTSLNHFFWNATDSCCDFDHLMPNDIGYLAAVIQDVEDNAAAGADNLPTPVPSYTIDKTRVWAFGHSNGGFMVNRMGCDMADKLTGIVSMAGETYKNQAMCAASAPITFLQVQGTADMTVPYGGGPAEGVAGLPPAPGAVETTLDWAKKNECDLTPDTSEPPITLQTGSTMPDTFKTVYNGCQGNGHTELWTIMGGPHSPSWDSSWGPDVFAYVTAYPK